MKATSRVIALSALMRVEEDGSYSNIALDHILSESGLSPRDKRFAAKLFYGVLENRLLLDYNIAVRSDRPLQKIDPPVAMIIRLGLYQLYFADSVPAAAAVNETVSLCGEWGCNASSGFVNGVLRSASRDGKPRLPSASKGKNKYYSIRYSCPEPIVKLWRQSYGDGLAEGILRSLSGRPPLCVRVNTLRTTGEELRKRLMEEGVNAAISPVVPDCLELSGTGAIEELPSFRAGLFHVQDAASQLCCRLLDAGPEDTVLDVCSAPGGKSFTCAEMMEDRGSIISCDLYSSRLSLVTSGALRLGISIITTRQGDSAELSADPFADRVLCDVPCSGLGVIRRKPELRYKPDTGVDELPPVQYSILCSASRCVRPGGLLLYSTCTLNPAENGMNARRFLDENPDFEPVPLSLPEGIQRGMEEPENQLTLFPHINNTDGFFVSLFRRK